MKSSIVIISMILALLLTYEPPTAQSVRFNVSPQVLREADSLSVDLTNIKLMDSIKTMSHKLDSAKTTCQKRLNLLKKQQKDIVKQINTIDTLTSLTLKDW